MIRSLILLSSFGLMAKAPSNDAPDAGGAGGNGAGDAGTTPPPPPPPPASKAKAAKVKVKVLVGAVGEDDKTYLKGETFLTTEERAEALGDSVEIVN